MIAMCREEEEEEEGMNNQDKGIGKFTEEGTYWTKLFSPGDKGRGQGRTDDAMSSGKIDQTNGMEENEAVRRGNKGRKQGRCSEDCGKDDGMTKNEEKNIKQEKGEEKIKRRTYAQEDEYTRRWGEEKVGTRNNREKKGTRNTETWNKNK